MKRSLMWYVIKQDTTFTSFDWDITRRIREIHAQSGNQAWVSVEPCTNEQIPKTFMYKVSRHLTEK